MDKCKVCRTYAPKHQTFCSQCGVRIYQFHTSVNAKPNVLTWLKGSISRVFESEEKKHFDSATELARFSFEAALSGMEEALRLEPRNQEFKDIIAIFYAGAADERIHKHVLPKLRPHITLMNISEEGIRRAAEWSTKTVLAAIKKMMLENESYEAEKSLDEAFQGALGLLDKSIATCRKYPGAYSGRAEAYINVADGILTAYQIYPKRILDSWDRLPDIGIERTAKNKLIQHGGVQLGFTDLNQFSEFPFAAEIIWLYKMAEEELQEALEFDPTDTKCYVKLSELVAQFGREEEAVNKRSKALAILNKAIQADKNDKESYLERAEIYDRLGEIKLAISDLEYALKLETMEFHLKSIKDRLDALRKRSTHLETI